MHDLSRSAAANGYHYGFPLSHRRTVMKRAFAVIILFFAVAAGAQSTLHERLTVDATDAPRNILHSTVTIPVTNGPVTLVYPKCIPGNHRPTGPVSNVIGLA